MAETTGVVVRFYDSKGYGFIKPDGGDEDLFVHHSEIQADGYRSLSVGQKVKFSVLKKDGKTKAVSVTSADGSSLDKNSKGGNGFSRGGKGGYKGGNGNGGERECYNCGGVGHIAIYCSSVATNVNGGRGCYKCGEPGHYAKECTGAAACYRCRGFGHLARECNIGPGGGGGVGGYSRSGDGRGCFNCGKPGHFARECPDVVSA